MNYEKKRKEMVKHLISEGRIYSEAVISAFGNVPREVFVPVSQKLSAYVDTPLSIGEGQTISAPHMVAIMVEALDLKDGLNVLEVGAGSGYHAAIVGHLIKPSGHLYSIERISSLANRARENIRKVGLEDNVTIIEADGSLGLESHAPYDRIFVTCASPGIPPPFVKQLKEGGQLLIPSGSSYVSDLLLVTKKGGEIDEKNLGGCAFVPLRGRYGFK
ncbi:MAG: protein-L-isoaspartate(D-aspartate) O-methyltransferase [Thermoplasmata archaeon]|nr:MAG: protein-L-isoaspartate(D-aspartate) O-methyltransferase [Thermoplasmata archaeon]